MHMHIWQVRMRRVPLRVSALCAPCIVAGGRPEISGPAQIIRTLQIQHTGHFDKGTNSLTPGEAKHHLLFDCNKCGQMWSVQLAFWASLTSSLCLLLINRMCI